MPQNTQPLAAQSGALFDELLVVLAQQGDREAFARLYARWNPRIVRAARRYTGSNDHASEIAQECWIGIWKGIAGLRDPARFRSFAFAVLHRRGSEAIAKTIAERRVRAKTASDGSGPEPCLAPSQADASALSSAFEGLPPDQRLAAHLHFVEGLTLLEIARVQSIPLGTAKSRLFHARRKLKLALSD